MSDKSKMIPKIAQFAIAILGVIFVLMIMFGNEDGVLTDSGSAGLNGAITITLIALIACAAAALLYSIYNIITAGKKAMPTLIGIGGFLVILGVSYALATDQMPGVDLEPGTIKWVGAGLGALYVLLGGTVAAIVIGEFSRLTK